MNTQLATATEIGSIGGQPTLLNEKQVSKLIGVSLSKLRQDRFKHVGIPYHKLGNKSVRYSISDVSAWVNQHRVVLG